jgi:hypothetical protein
MPKQRILDGPIGNGWIDEVRNADGIHFVARWKKYIPDPSAPEGRQRVNGGQHILGPKVYHGPGLKSKTDAEKEWKICDGIMGRTNLPVSDRAKELLGGSLKKTRMDSASVVRRAGPGRSPGFTTTSWVRKSCHGLATPPCVKSVSRICRST